MCSVLKMDTGVRQIKLVILLNGKDQIRPVETAAHGPDVTLPH